MFKSLTRDKIPKAQNDSHQCLCQWFSTFLVGGTLSNKKNNLGANSSLKLGQNHTCTIFTYYGILKFGGTPEKISRHTNASWNTG